MIENKKIIDRNTVIKGLRFTIIVSLLISALIILFTIDRESLLQVISTIKPEFISYLLIIVFLHWFFAALRLKVMVKAIGDWISLKDSLIIFMAGAFVSNVTPFATGGGPFQIYFLHKKGVNIGKSSTVIVIQFVLRLFFFGILAPVFFIFFNWAISPGIIPDYLFYLAFGFGVLMSVIIIVFILVPKISNKLIRAILEIDKINTFVKNNHKAKRWLVKARKEVREFRYSLMVLSKNKGLLVISGLCTIALWSMLFSIIPVLLIGLGEEAHFFQAYVMQTLFYLILPYMPTPGASGIAEVGSASLFISFIPKPLIGLVIFGWRLFSFYLVLLIGGYFALKEISKSRRTDNA